MEKLHPLLRFNLVLLSGILICTVLFYAKQILVLLAFGALFAMLMNPVSEKFEKKGMKRVWSTVLCVLLMFLIISGLISLVVTQFVNIGQQMPEIQQKVEQNMHHFQEFVQEKFNIAPKKQIELLKKQFSSVGQSAFMFAGNMVTGVFGILAYLVMILVFMFLFLLQKEKYKAFFIKIFTKNNTEDSEKVVDEIVHVSYNYLTGMMMSMGIIAVLYSIGFLIIGLKNAILLAAIAAALLIIPYVGAFIGGLFPLAMALLTEGSVESAIGVICVMVFVQTIDNNLIEPYIVGGQVKLSAVTTIVALFAGGLVWGIPGVILFLPLTGILRIIFDHVESLRPYGYLIGDQERETPSSKLHHMIKGWFGKK